MVGLQEKLTIMIDNYAKTYDRYKCLSYDDPTYNSSLKVATDRFNIVPYMLDELYTNSIIGYRMYCDLSYHHAQTRKIYSIPNSVIILN